MFMRLLNGAVEGVMTVLGVLLWVVIPFRPVHPDFLTHPKFEKMELAFGGLFSFVRKARFGGLCF